MAPTRCRPPTNFMRWQDRSVQFEEPEFLPGKFRLDQQRDRTPLKPLTLAPPPPAGYSRHLTIQQWGRHANRRVGATPGLPDDEPGRFVGVRVRQPGRGRAAVPDPGLV